MKTINLAGPWRLSGKNRKISVPARLPGDNFSDLLKAGVIRDPYWAKQELDARWIGREDWVWEREFRVAEDFLREESVFLHCDRVDTVAAIYVNGRLAGRARNAFLRHRFEVKKHLRPGVNRLRIEISSPEKAALAESRRLPYPIPHSNFPVQSPHRNLLRKPQCHGGWDWGPCLMVSGVYGGIHLGATSLGRIEHVFTDQKHGRSGVEVTVHCEVESPRGGDAVLEAGLGGRTARRPVKLRPGLNLLSCAVSIPKPRLWWPNGHGGQPLYDLEVKVAGDTARKRIGLRTIEVRNREDAHGLSMEFIVNGVPVFCKGANWIPSDALPRRQTPGAIRDLLGSAARAHMNMIRVWGGGQYETDEFYGMCDEMGLLVWQDFMFACAAYPASEPFLATVRREAEYQVKRLRDHPSLALWCGNNENLGALNWHAETRAGRDRYVVDYDRLNEGVLGETVRRLDPARLFWPSSPCGGPGDYSDCWHDDRRGDMHFWSVWHEGKPFEAYLGIRPRFCSEFGYQSFPSLDTIRAYAEPGQWNPASPVMEHHQRNPGGNARIIENMARYFRFPAGFGNFVYLSQVQQALAIKTAVEHFRRLRPVCMGAVYWQLNDMWPVCSWASLEYGGKWKLLHYVAKRFYAPLLVSAVQTGGNVEIWAHNDGVRPARAAVTARVMDFSGKVLRVLRLGGSIPAGRAARLTSAPLAGLAPDPSKAFLSLERRAGGEWAFNDLFFCEYKKCGLEPPRIEFDAREEKGGFAVTCRSRKPAFWVAFDAPGIRGEFDDNAFTLLPDRPRTLRFTPKVKTTLARFKKALQINHLQAIT